MHGRPFGGRILAARNIDDALVSARKASEEYPQSLSISKEGEKRKRKGLSSRNRRGQKIIAMPIGMMKRGRKGGKEVVVGFRRRV
jgi:hypothetical protein